MPGLAESSRAVPDARLVWRSGCLALQLKNPGMPYQRIAAVEQLGVFLCLRVAAAQLGLLPMDKSSRGIGRSRKRRTRCRTRIFGFFPHAVNVTYM
ncbi:hypothetical protein D3C78_1761610 [compost metagenome]